MDSVLVGLDPTIKDKLQHLTENERAALEAFVSRLHQHYGDDVLRVDLFGSKARGDFDAESDIDVLIVARFPEDEHWKHWKQITDIAWDVELEYGIVMSTVIKTPVEFNRMQRDRLLLYRNIEEDGITLWMTQRDAPMYKFA
ncbi:MAG: nucleotidyltransferase domain-containing protein [Anaerolineales bacterium]